MFFLGFALDEDTCKENDDCKGKLSLCKDSAICVDEVCKCRMLKMVAAPFKIVFDEDLYVVFDEDLYVLFMYFCFALSVS